MQPYLPEQVLPNPDAPTFDIVLATLNARYIHAAFGLRCLQANLGSLQPASQIQEFTTQTRPLVIAETLLAASPRIVGLGVYIWNTTETLALVRLLKALEPGLIIVLGGPEISFETDQQPLFVLADHVITGEGELAFAALCHQLLGPTANVHAAAMPAVDRPPPPKLIPGGLPDPAALALPYDLYTDADIADRVLYVEASRGCPYRCEFCLSALDKSVRQFPLEAFLAAMTTLLDRGARSFKFVDRTFNLSPRTSEAILRFFLGRIAELGPDDGLFLHFEMVPDRFPVALRSLIAAFPPGAVQFEVGVQTLNEDVAARIDRRQRNDKVFENLHFLDQHTGVHVHADLIIGLPGEDLASFGLGFDRLLATGVDEIQVGILKRLRGAPIAHHTAAWQMLYSPLPPYELLRNRDLTATHMQQMRGFARFWDLFANSGRFQQTLPLLLAGDAPSDEPDTSAAPHTPNTPATSGAFDAFLRFSDWLRDHVGQSHALSLQRCVGALFTYLVSVRGLRPEDAAAPLAADYRRVSKKQHVPAVLQRHVKTVSAPASSAPIASASAATVAPTSAPPTSARPASAAPSRQRRHQP